MMNEQAAGRVSNSAANPLSASKPGENSAAGQLGQIISKRLISGRFLTLGGGFLREKGVFPLMAGEIRRSPARRPLRRARAGHAPGRVEPDAAEAAEELGQSQPVRQWQRRRQERGDVGPQMVGVAGTEEDDIDPG